ncbi:MULTISPECIES: ParB/RepB/Spo0J family partition protein [Streptomycetaceae]|uniref:ParB/RepB/Spo0J family partition protein n=1 Tax=Streptomycetaceae TaxID=2062 RepID=UPI00300946FA
MTAVQTARAAWPTLPVDQLTAHPGNTLPYPDAPLVADIADNGVSDPLLVVITSAGTLVADGLRRLAAAQAAGLAEVPVTHRPVIRLSLLTPHPDNPRDELDINPGFVASFATPDGCRVPIKVRVLEDGTRQIVDGHRRYFGAEAAGLTHVPYEEDERDDAGTYLDMVTTAKHRAGLSEREEAAALFSAAEAGAGIKRLAAAAGTTQKRVKATLRAMGSQAVRAVEDTAGALTLETATALADLEARDAEAAAQVAAELADRPRQSVSWLVRRTMTELDQREELDAQREELRAAGARMLAEAELGPKAAPLYQIAGDTSQHATQCQGAVWVLRQGATAYAEFCANAPFFGHTVLDPNGGTIKRESAAARRRRIAGNLDWDTAQQLRREWLAELITRRSLPRAMADLMAQVVARAMASGIGAKLFDSRADDLSSVIGATTYTTRADLEKRWTQPKDAVRITFAIVAAAYETYANRTVWRTGEDSQDQARRAAATQWLTWITAPGLDYQPSPIETAVRDDEDYEPDSAE